MPPNAHDGPDGSDGRADVGATDGKPDREDARRADSVNRAGGPGSDGTTAGDPDDGRPGPDGFEDRYTALAVADDATVIYDRDNHRAWLQSDRSVGLDDLA